MSTETLLPTGKKKVRIVTVVTVQSIKSFSCYRDSFEREMPSKQRRLVGSMFGQIWSTAGTSGVISDKKAQILKFLSGQKWVVSGNFGIKHLWGLSGVLVKLTIIGTPGWVPSSINRTRSLLRWEMPVGCWKLAYCTQSHGHDICLRLTYDTALLSHARKSLNGPQWKELKWRFTVVGCFFFLPGLIWFSNLAF